MTENDTHKILKSELKKMDGKECPLKDKDGKVIGWAKLYYVEGVLKGEMEMKNGKKFKGVVEAGDLDIMNDPSVKT